MPMMPTAQWKEMRNKEIRSKVKCGIIMAGCFSIGFGVPTLIDAQNADTYIREDYISIIEKECNDKALCVELVEALVESESSGQADVVSKANCVGLMQVSATYSGYSKYELMNPEINIEAGTDILLDLFEKYKDIEVVLTAYNTGEYSYATKTAIESGEGNKYAKKIVKRAEQLERLHYK